MGRAPGDHADPGDRSTGSVLHDPRERASRKRVGIYRNFRRPKAAVGNMESNGPRRNRRVEPDNHRLKRRRGVCYGKRDL